MNRLELYLVYSFCLFIVVLFWTPVYFLMTGN
jgi:hypothetical protein